ncbi:MAG: M48 family metalloprotease [Planctomycetales bacterium]|nr:M48 family metalloprotease [Planctomycetales bacterium]
MPIDRRPMATNGKPIPKLQELVDDLATTNRIGFLWLVLQVVCMAVVGYMIDWPAVLLAPLTSSVAIGLVVGQPIISILRLWTQNKKEIGALKETTRFGQYDKHRLLSIFQETVRRLGIPKPHPRVFITPDKTLNASSVRLGLLGLVRSLNGIYLNRQVLHRLTPDELQDLMGHELGHYSKYYLLNSRLMILSLTLGAMLGLLIGQWTGMSSFLSLILSAACASLLGKIDGSLWVSVGPKIEYLCDSYGSQASSVLTSINGLLKIGLEAEMQQQIQKHAILEARRGELSSQSVLQAVQQAIPFGSVSREELLKSVEREIAKRADRSKNVSLTGFLDYAWNSGTHAALDEELEAELQKLEILETLPRLAWEELLPSGTDSLFDEYTVGNLIELIMAQPNAPLFRLLTEIGLQYDYHPPFRDRILFLWYNRRDIEFTRTGW